MKYSLKHIDRNIAIYNVSDQPDKIFKISPASAYLNLNSQERDIVFDNIIDKQHRQAELKTKHNEQ